MFWLHTESVVTAGDLIIYSLIMVNLKRLSVAHNIQWNSRISNEQYIGKDLIFVVPFIVLL